MKKIILGFVAAATVVACSGKQDVQPQSAVAAPSKQQVPAAKLAAPAQEAAGQLTGTVLESHDSACETSAVRYRIGTPIVELFSSHTR